jgi:hypothetical protein
MRVATGLAGNVVSYDHPTSIAARVWFAQNQSGIAIKSPFTDDRNGSNLALPQTPGGGLLSDVKLKK